MRFLLDAHVPPSLMAVFASAGHEAEHVSDVLDGWTTGAREIAAYADEHGCIVVSKDKDFRNLQLAAATSRKLLHLRVGNITNHELFDLIGARIQDIVRALDEAAFVELHRAVLVTNRGPGDEL